MTSAEGLRKAGSTIQGRVEKAGEGRLVLLGETQESWTRDDAPWSQTWPSTVRWERVAHGPRKVVLDGETYARPKGDPVPPGLASPMPAAPTCDADDCARGFAIGTWARVAAGVDYPYLDVTCPKGHAWRQESTAWGPGPSFFSGSIERLLASSPPS